MERSPRTNCVFARLCLCLCLCLGLIAGPLTLNAQETDDAETDSVGIADIMEILSSQQAQLDEQKQLITGLQNRYDQAKKAYTKDIAQQKSMIDEQRSTMRTMQAKIDALTAFDPAQMSEEEKEFRSRLETLEDSIESSQNAASTTFDAESFPGSIPIGGTSAAIRIGGFVKANYIQDFDTIGSTDRFIVGSIPTDPVDQGDPRAALTVSQSRLNFDLRDNTDVGVLRGFIEADFAGVGDTFRLRHAYGQLDDILAGKTWSNFVDVEASPEDIDFEGLNGRINTRKTQFRWFPRIGEEWNLIASLEDPDPQINNGEAVSLLPDIVTSMRRDWFDRFHVKTSLVIRQIEGRWDVDDSVKDDALGWGLSFSGKAPMTRWDPRDNFLFQFNLGEGFGSLVNDLATLEEGDAVFDANGNLKALPVLAGYVAFQKWWQGTVRSTFVASIVKVDTYSFQPPEAYEATQRLSGNLIWSPTSRVDLGAELLYGRREDKDGSDGNAWQMQLSSKYRF
ncbi:MAG: DcaP family trimeric outer membrane transporter [Gammaproteobacteria bacterium]